MKAPIPIGVGHAIITFIGLTKFNLFAKYTSEAETKGETIKGIAIILFFTIGIPKIIGSFILKTPIGNDSLDTVLYSSRFEKKKMAKIKAKVTPDPPI